MISATRPPFDWERFWLSRTDIIDLSDGGFFVDPTQPYAHSVARPLSALADYRALALLGEPGIGKSTTLREEAARLLSQSADDVTSIHIDLRAFSSEPLLYKKLFENDTFVGWASGDTKLIIQLDSLDEALLRIDSIASLLADELPKYPTARLSIRIACRTAVWPSSTLELALKGIWGDSYVGVFELAPLRRRDVVNAAETLGIDPEKFIKELYAANVIPFAIKPLTLNLLLDLFKKDGKLPRSVAEIYSRGCLKLCEEQNASRRDAGRFGSYTAAQKLRIASRIAAATMFANRYAIWTGPETEVVPDEDIPLSALIGGPEQGDFVSFEVGESAVRETLDTGLFTSRGSNRMGWAHLGYAEFLAAAYLPTKSVPAATVLKLVVHPSGGLVPQLGVVTAWIASIDRDVRQKLIDLDPLILVRGDLTSWSESDLESLTGSMLAALNENRVHDFSTGVFSVGVAAFYDRLNHSRLAEQLRPYIDDSTKNVTSRRTAISIAKRCAIRELQPELLRLALDVHADTHLRSRAIDALSQCGDETVPAELLPIVRGELGDDPDDEMLGYALELLWPKCLRAENLFPLLRVPHEGFFGAYEMFLTTTLPKTLTVADLPVALAWATSLANAKPAADEFHRRSLADAIFVQAWNNLEQPGVIEPLVTYVLSRFQHFHDLLGVRTSREVEAFNAGLTSESYRRRLFMLALLRLGVDDTSAYHLRRQQLLQTSDLNWLLSIAPGSPECDPSINAATLCNLIKSIVDLYDATQFDVVYKTATTWPLLWQTFHHVFDGIPLDSLEVRQLRENLEMQSELNRRTRPPIAPEPFRLITEELDKFEKGDTDAWWRINRYLTLTPISRAFGSVLEYSIAETPGWIAADSPTRDRILNAAAQFLRAAPSFAKKWVCKQPQSVFHSDLSAFRAFLLLKEHDLKTYRNIQIDVWRKWAPVIAAIPRSNVDGKSSQGQVIIDALDAAPVEFVGTVRKIIQAERRRQSKATDKSQIVPGGSFFIIRLLEGCWDNEALKEGVFAELKNRNNSTDQFACILDVLLDAEFLPAHAAALGYVKRGPKEPRAMPSAISLAVHKPGRGWAEIWKLIESDEALGEKFFLEMGQRYRLRDTFLVDLTERELATLYVYLERAFPRQAGVGASVGPHWVGPRESVNHLRDGILPQIADRGTEAGVDAIRWINGQLPDLSWLSFYLLQAQHVMRIKTWSPLSPIELFRLLASRDRTLVRSPEDLVDLLVAALRKYEAELHGEQNPIRALWDRQESGNTFYPVDEDAFSDAVRLFLKRELVDAGIVVNREVEIARVPGARLGTRTDIRVDAVRSTATGSYDRITSVIESKGCWNKALYTDLKDQLYGDYMMRLQVAIGIYLVAWFDKAKWDSRDYRRRQAPDLTPLQAQEQLEAEAASVPAGYSVKPIVIDCHAP
jgi:hypothetical protein